MTIDEDCQFLKLPLINQVILHEGDDVQTITNLSGEIVTNSIFIGGEFNTATMDGIRLAAYIMQNNTTVLSSSSCTFNIYKITTPNWTETLLYTTSGSVQLNNYFFASIDEATLGLLLDGDPTLMVEAVMVRLGKTYKNRVYLNQLGIFDSYLKQRRQLNIIQASEITKKTPING